ncbi:MAG: hypothetical protein EBY80_10630 [Actinobacteria bacterium]|jgi:hypothetical protein|nr:hypothetical protein [Actinomycetota bacterium]
MPTHILKKVRQQAVVQYVGSGSTTIDLASLALADETFDRANSKVTLAHVYFHFATAGTIARASGNTILEFAAGAMDNWDFAGQGGFVLNQDANANVVINMGASSGTVILTLHKSAGFTAPNNQTLPDYLKI